MSRPKKQAKDVLRMLASVFGRKKPPPAQGGDGGQAAKHVKVSRDANANERVYLNAVTEDQKRECVPTSDTHDRAHGKFGASGMLIPAANRSGRLLVTDSKPRKYPLCQLNLQGVPVDSSYDETYVREQWLVQQGLLAGTTKGIRYDVKGCEEYMSRVRRRPRNSEQKEGQGGSHEPTND